MHSKTVLITGGAKRVGAAICRLLHSEGANLMIHYRSSLGEASALAAELNAIRAQSVALVQADLLDIATLPKLVHECEKVFGGLDVLINNASSFYPTEVGNIDETSWVDLIGTNLKAPLFLSQAAAASLKKNAGCIVNITDIHAERPMKSYVVYSIGKAGLVAMTKSLARELGPQVRVNAVSPGPIMGEAQDAVQAAHIKPMVARVPVGRLGTPDEVAAAVALLASDEGAFINGQMIQVNGGAET